MDQENGVPDLETSTTLSIEPTAGTLTLASDGTFTYTHGGGAETTDQFVYEVCINGSQTCSHQKGLVTVISNGTPQPGTDAIELDEGGTATRLDNNDNSVLDNDTDPDGDDLDVTTTPVSGPDHGNLSLSSNGTFSYTHDGTENFTDSFVYEVCDDGSPSECANGTVNITIAEINESPTANGETLSNIGEDSGVRVITFSALTGNDSAGDGEDATQSLVVSDVSSPVGGSVSISGNTVRFTPTADYSGPASFDYEIEDDGTTDGSPDPLTDSATADFTIFETNDAPVAQGESLGDVAEDSGAFDTTIASLLSNDVAGPLDESGQALSITAITGAVGGSAQIVTNVVRFTPAADFAGAASFAYTVTDDGTTDGAADPQSSDATATFTITERNDPPVAEADALSSVAEDSGPRAIAAADLVSNDSDGAANESGQTLTVTAVANAVGGTVAMNGSTVTFTPDDEFFGGASFTYDVTDDGTTAGSPDPLTDSATVSFSVTRVNDAPVASPETLSDVAEDAPDLRIPFATLLSNDVAGPPEEVAQELTIISVGNGTGGSAVIDGTDVVFALAADYNGAASFEYTIQDDGRTGGANDPKSDTTQASWTVTSVNDAPALTNDTLTDVLAPGASVDVPATDLLNNDAPGPADESAQSLTVTGVGNPLGGTVQLSAGHHHVYRRRAIHRARRFRLHTVEDDGTSDGSSDPQSSTGRVTVSVQLANTAPLVRSDAIVVTRGGTSSALQDYRTSIIGNDDEVDGETLSATAQTDAPTNAGTVSIASDGTFTYVHAGGTVDFDQFDYEVCDNASPTPNCSTGTVTVGGG